MNSLNSSLSEDGATAGAITGGGVGACDKTGVGMGMPLHSIGIAPTSSSSSADREGSDKSYGKHKFRLLYWSNRELKR